MFHHDVEKKKKERRTAKRYGREGGSISDSICRYKSSGTRNTLTASTTARLREREKRREGGGKGGRKEERGKSKSFSINIIYCTANHAGWSRRVACARARKHRDLTPRARYTRITVVGGKPSWPLEEASGGSPQGYATTTPVATPENQPNPPHSPPPRAPFRRSLQPPHSVRR